MKTMKSAAAVPSEASTGASLQPYWLPPHESPSSRGTLTPTSSAAPVQSTMALPRWRYQGMPKATSASASVATGMLM